MPTTTVGARIRTFRKQTPNFTQALLAEAAGLTREQLVRIETGRTDPTLKTLIKLADALETTVADLVSDLRLRGL